MFTKSSREQDRNTRPKTDTSSPRHNKASSNTSAAATATVATATTSRMGGSGATSAEQTRFSLMQKTKSRLPARSSIIQPYDPWIGIRTALILGSCLLFFIVYALYKGRCRGSTSSTYKGNEYFERYRARLEEKYNRPDWERGKRAATRRQLQLELDHEDCSMEQRLVKQWLESQPLAAGSHGDALTPDFICPGCRCVIEQRLPLPWRRRLLPLQLQHSQQLVAEDDVDANNPSPQHSSPRPPPLMTSSVLQAINKGQCQSNHATISITAAEVNPARDHVSDVTAAMAENSNLTAASTTFEGARPKVKQTQAMT